MNGWNPAGKESIHEQHIEVSKYAIREVRNEETEEMENI